MKTTAMMIAMSMLGTSVHARQVERADGRTVTVYLETVAAQSPEVCMARELAARMLARAGAKIVWRAGEPSASVLKRERPIVIRITSDTPASEYPGGLAFALPYEGVHIQIFYDRVRAAEPLLPQVALAHVLAHEITHVLQGIVRHSDSGLMKAHWTASDFRNMLRKPLAYTPDDIELIERGLAARAALNSEVKTTANPTSRAE